MAAAARRPWPAVVRPIVSAIGLALLAVLLSQQDWGRLRTLALGIGWERILIALAMIAGSRLAVAGRWHVLLRALGAPVDWHETFPITFAGLFSANFLPTTVGGDVVRLAGAFQLDIDKADSAASLIVDRLVGMAGMALALPFGLAAFAGGPPPAAHGLGPIEATTAMAAGAPGSAVGRVRSVLGRVGRALGRWRRRPGALLTALGLTLVHMSLLFGVLHLLLRGMGESRGFLQLAGAWSVVYFITLFPISVNGLGIQELALTAVFGRALALPGDATLILALAIRVLTMFASLPGALFLGRLLPHARRLGAADIGI